MNQETNDVNRPTHLGSSSRQAIWAAHTSWAATYFALFTLQALLGDVIVIWDELVNGSHQSWVDTYTGIIQGIGIVGIASAINAFVVTEVLRNMMLLSDWVRMNLVEPAIERRREEGREEGRAEGRKQGRAEGRKEGRAEMILEMKDWELRRQEAEERGEPFDEPPPYLRN